jgi:hypothetical protein
MIMRQHKSIYQRVQARQWPYGWAAALSTLALAATLASAQTNSSPPGPGPERENPVAQAGLRTVRLETNDVPMVEEREVVVPSPEAGGNPADAVPAPAVGPGSEPPATPNSDASMVTDSKSGSAAAAAPATGVSTSSSTSAAGSGPKPGPASSNRPARLEDKGRTSGSGAPTPRPGGSTATPEFSAFKIISDRNIFDPNRTPRRSNTVRARPKTVESFTLVGIMSYEKGDFAFFNGTSSSYRKALKPNDSIAGYKLTSISPNSVRLSSGKKDVEIKIGSQLRREEEGEWTLSTQSETYATAPVADSSSSAKSADSSPASDGAENEVLKRLMQRREQE